MTRIYRTLVRGRLRQQTSLVVGGSSARIGGADVQCARDGQGRLTIPGTSLAGCLVETAGRVFPDLFQPRESRAELWRRITGKTRTGVADDVLQSLWHFRPAHRTTEWVEWRQGVGLRQATSAAATEARALYDLETIPAGEAWDLFLDVDTLRGGDKLEAVGLLALGEWGQGRCWLGAGPARGLGWMRLEDLEVLRLPATAEALDSWPDSTRSLEETWARARAIPGTEAFDGQRAATLASGLWGGPLPLGRFCYVELAGEVMAGRRGDGYGWDTLSVGGHPAGFRAPLEDLLMSPLGERRADYLAGHDPDTPVLTSGSGEDSQKPLVPGSGLRGPLRHAASKLYRGLHPGAEIVDPNADDPQRPGRRRETSSDPVSLLFGLTGQCGRLLVADARPAEAVSCRLVCLQQHAEDEFTGGVYGSGKFDRTAVLEGAFCFRMVVEAPTADDMGGYLETLKPALRLAELGFVPLGGAKTRGAGGGPWRFTAIEYGRAGEPPQRLLLQDGASVVDTIGRVDFGAEEATS
jgi:CRISPR/Cas system CSM-associated protein Csm3 (group 7 of RAMP superfamily)